MAELRGYYFTVDEISGVDYLRIYPTDKTLTHYEKVPTLAEVNDALGTSYQTIDIYLGGILSNGIFANCSNMIAPPKLPQDGLMICRNAFYRAYALQIAPMLQAGSTEVDYCFDACSSLVSTPVIPKTATSMRYMFRNSGIYTPPSIPADVTKVSHLFEGCTNLGGEMIVRPTGSFSGERADAFKNTVKPITLYGNQSTCNYLANTANNNNVSWSPWYDPVPAVTNRGQGSKTTAADMTRMVRNGALAVDTYAPGRMVYQQGDIVREDEWIALVDAAKTIDPTITLSTNYMNLNKIEAAFESAL